MMRKWADSWNRTDLDAFAATFDDEAELITDPSWMEAGPFKGRAAIRAWFEGLKESWAERDVIVLKELFEVGEQVVARVDWQVRGRASGIRPHSTRQASTSSSGAGLSGSSGTSTTRKPSKPSGCRSKTLTLTPPNNAGNPAAARLSRSGPGWIRTIDRRVMSPLL